MLTISLQIKMDFSICHSSSKCSKLGHYTSFCKSNRGLSQLGCSPVCNSVVFALFEQKYDV